MQQEKADVCAGSAQLERQGSGEHLDHPENCDFGAKMFWQEARKHTRTEKQRKT